MTVAPVVAKGLAGVYADHTAISTIAEDIGSLVYRGYAVQDLAAHCTFEDVAWLLWKGELPTPEERAAFVAEERAVRVLSPTLMNVLRQSPPSAHPMDTLRTAVSFLGEEDSTLDDGTPAANLKRSIALLARIPTVIAAAFRLRKGQNPIAPRADLGLAENFFYMYSGAVPDPEVVKFFDASLIFYAEHGFNASTFAARVVASTLSDVYAAVAAAVGALKGRLHGGANEAVMHMLLEIDHPSRARAWIDAALEDKASRIMGFGHRIYRNGDSRVPYMTDVLRKMAARSGGEKWVEIENILSAVMLERKGIHPNVDYPVGPLYYMMGFDIPVFTPIFVMSRITGWTAHVMEQRQNNKLVRPLSVYDGPALRRVSA